MSGAIPISVGSDSSPRASHTIASVVSHQACTAPPPAPLPPSLLPPLREDLRLFAAAAQHDGSPAWMIHDPVSNRFFRIGWVEFELLSRWHLQSPHLMMAQVQHETTLPVTLQTITGLIEFLQVQQLLRASDSAASQLLNQVADKQRGGKINWLLHNYLFFRLPLVHPSRFLQSTLPFVAIFYSKVFLVFTLACTALGILLAARQWDTFVHTFTDFLSPSGLIGYAVALTVAKTLHELGHAYTSTRYGARVAHMGVAFLVMWPMLYTDTGESWKLRDRRKRFNIAAAGIATELAIAGFATLAWSLTEDGALRSSLFFLATASWIITIGINASPFMRFDGYFLLSDALDFPNLHTRAGALARVFLRRKLLGWDEPWPEVLPSHQHRGLIAFALVTWVYRFFVFLGIAAAVYWFFFKALGIFLFVVEIVWFIAKPVYSEISVWAKRWRETSMRAWLAWSIFFILFVLAVAVPWRSTISAEGLMRADQQVLIYSPLSARVQSIRSAGPIKAGETIALLESPDTRSKANQSAGLARAAALQLDQTIGKDDGAETRGMLTEQLRERLAEVQAQNTELAKLALTASFNGVLLDRDPQLAPGVWLNPSQAIAVLVNPNRWIAEVLVEQRDLERIKIGSLARFHVRGQANAPINGAVIAMDSTRAQVLPHAMLATDHGGRIPAVKVAGTGNNGALSPRDSLYRVRLQLDTSQGLPIQSVTAGVVMIDASSRSLMGQWIKTAAALFVRESGF